MGAELCVTLERQFVRCASSLLPLMQEEGVTDILINGVKSLFVERDGELFSLPSPFKNVESILDFIERLLVPIGKRIDAAQPFADGRLLDGSRFHIMLPPIAPDGPFICIRKWRNEQKAPLVSFGPEGVVRWLREQVLNRANILISGGTGSGKTTLLCRLLDELSLSRPTERVAILEECRELRTIHSHVVSLEARAPTPEGKGGVTLRTLVHNALRMRPDRIIIGECRGGEAFDILQAMNTGHLGSFSTIHSNSALDALRRLETLALLAGVQVPLTVVRRWVASNVHVVVQLRQELSHRKISEILLVRGLEGEIYRVHPKFRAGA